MSECGNRMNEIPVMTFPIKERISSKLFIGRNAALFIRENWIRGVTSEADQRVGISYLEERVSCAEMLS